MADAISREDLDKVHTEVKLLRSEVEKKEEGHKADQEKIDRLNDSLDAAEVKNETVSNDLAEANGKITQLMDLKESIESGEAEFLKTTVETKARIEELEAEIAKRSSKGNKLDEDWHETIDYKLFEAFCRVGPDDRRLDEIDPEYKALLRTDSSVAGGFLTNTEMDSQMIKKIIEVSNMRAIASVRQTTEKAMEIAVRTSIGEAFYEGEGEQNQEAASAYGSETMHTYRLSATTPATQDQLMNSAFNMETEILGDTGEMFASKEGLKFVLGTAVKQPEGFLLNTEVIANLRNTAASGVLDADAILLVQGDLKRGHNPRFVFNRQTLSIARTLKGAATGNDHYLWSPGLDGSAANMLAGSPYTILQDMPVIAAGSDSIAYGDFVRGYRILDRTGMTVIRDDVTLADSAIVRFVFHKWNNGQVVNAEAIKLLRIKA